MSYFVKQEDPEKPGEFVYVEVSDSELELPPDVLKKKVLDHPEYKKVKTESVTRKEKLREQQARLNELLSGEDTDEDAGDTTASQKQAKPEQQSGEAAKPLDEDALYAKFIARLEADRKAAEEANTNRRTQLTSLLEKHGLGEDALELLEVATDPVLMAARLEKSNYRFDDTIGGSPAKPDKEALLSNVLKNLDLDGD